VIAYFDTSALIPLVIAETGTAAAGRLWLSAERRVSVRLARVEALAALAQAERQGRISSADLGVGKRAIARVLDQLDFVEIDDGLTRGAADLAEKFALRAYEAMHAAAASRAQDGDLVLVAGDRGLLAVAQAIGLAVAPIG
jgi:predicted nucleic acid-binding protein